MRLIRSLGIRPLGACRSVRDLTCLDLEKASKSEATSRRRPWDDSAQPSNRIHAAGLLTTSAVVNRHTTPSLPERIPGRHQLRNGAIRQDLFQHIESLALRRVVRSDFQARARRFSRERRIHKCDSTTAKKENVQTKYHVDMVLRHRRLSTNNYHTCTRMVCYVLEAISVLDP